LIHRRAAGSAPAVRRFLHGLMPVMGIQSLTVLYG
jgi:hypothetical protein